MRKAVLLGLLLGLMVFTSAHSKSRVSYISPDEIRALERTGALFPIGTGSWRTRGGLILRGRDPEGLTRLDHVMKHTVNIPGREKHGVFILGKGHVIDLMDRTWKKIHHDKPAGKERGGRTAYTIDTGKVIGYLGGRAGQDNEPRRLKSVRLVIRTGTTEVITFFPI